MIPNFTEPESLLIVPQSLIDRLKVEELFPIPQPFEIEVGAGDGSFIAAYAAAHRQTNFLAIERLLGRLRKIDRKGRRAGLTNLRGIRIEAAYALEYMLPAQAATAIHIYFPDPWPKRKHRPNRLINERFPEIARRNLKPDGVIYLRTDDVDYFEQMERVFDAAKAHFQRTETPATLKAFTTDFERGFNAKGIPTNYAAYKRVG